jgi:hypothetical protein
MEEQQWPYNLPIWRRFYRAVSPDGKLVARIDPAHERSMSNPTSGILCVSNGVHIERCSPSFVWSEDSKFLAVPQYSGFWGRPRVLVISFEKMAVYKSKASAWNYQPETFVGGRLVVSVNPAKKKKESVEFRIPEELGTAFTWYWQVSWPEEGREVKVVMPNK